MLRNIVVVVVVVMLKIIYFSVVNYSSLSCYIYEVKNYFMMIKCKKDTNCVFFYSNKLLFKNTVGILSKNLFILR
jgi:hypothetical protein